jgi:hypothetical protein
MSPDETFPVPPEVTQQQIDEFAEIATRRIAQHANAVDHPAPRPRPEILLPLEPGVIREIVSPERIDTAEELQRELHRLRARYTPFQANHAPGLPRLRPCLPLEKFDWRPVVPTGAEPAAWSEVTIPHYGGPVGRAAAHYATTFCVTPDLLAGGALWICFRGVDYVATVSVNGKFVGRHEGFFEPFEFEITAAVRTGENRLLIEVENDSPNKGLPGLNVPDGEKIYAATGPGWDEPGRGWHHCPPGFGIYQPVRIEGRPRLFLDDLHVRPDPALRQVEVWVETFSSDLAAKPVRLELAVYGRNFRAVICEGWEAPERLPAAGVNRSLYKLTIPVADWRIWDLETPWLYQVQVRLLRADGQVIDVAERQFGLRTFTQDETESPKGRYFLNGREIRLRGANTMGFEQQAVMRGDLAGLTDDLLLAKLTRMNFLRFTQRPVQAEVYDLCDQLGLLAQTDFPHFGWVRRTACAETVRQVAQMARLVRTHPCRITYSLMNEPYGIEVPHRHLTRPELERLLRASREMLLLEDPDAVIKACDGDYNPPPPFGLPDEHIYTLWYNGHAIPFGKLHRGYFPPVAKGWCYGCGEFGAEGLDAAELMRRRYPPAWLPGPADDEARWTPDRIPFCQTAKAHTVFFETPRGLEEWVAASQAHQAFATRFMTEAFRRDRQLVSCAIHLFIDAWPAGWMKAIVDCERRPKPAWFAYREALAPLMANLRSDRRTCWAGEEMRTEAWLCNDTTEALRAGGGLVYTVELDGKIQASGLAPATVAECDSQFQGFIAWTAPAVATRATVGLHFGLRGGDGLIRHDTRLEFDVFPRPSGGGAVQWFGDEEGAAGRVGRALSRRNSPGAAVIVIDTWPTDGDAAELLDRVRRGARLLFCPVQPGRHTIAGREVEVFDIGSGSRLILEQGAQGSFVASREPGHPALAGFAARDFSYWTHEREGVIAAVHHRAFRGAGWLPVLTWGSASQGLVVGECPLGAGHIYVCTLELRDQMRQNPVASLFLRRLLGLDHP